MKRELFSIERKLNKVFIVSAAGRQVVNNNSRFMSDTEAETAKTAAFLNRFIG